MSYTPTGTGHCANCGRDVAAHDGGHEYDHDHLHHECRECGLSPENRLHDVGRVLRCPAGDWTEIIGAMPDFPLPEVRDE